MCSACSLFSLMRLSLVSADQIEQREQEDPDNVHEMPVQAEVLNKRDVAAGVCSGAGAEDHEPQDADADDHVQGVHAGHGKVQREVQLGVARHVEGQRLVPRGLGRRVGIWIEKRVQAVVETGNVVLLNLLRVLDALDAQKAQAQ